MEWDKISTGKPRNDMGGLQESETNKGSAGVDEISMQEFDADRSKHVYKLSAS